MKRPSLGFPARGEWGGRQDGRGIYCSPSFAGARIPLSESTTNANGPIGGHTKDLAPCIGAKKSEICPIHFHRELRLVGASGLLQPVLLTLQHAGISWGFH